MGTYQMVGAFCKNEYDPNPCGSSKEQIAPQLLWSRRLPDGNVMSAQEWLNGEILTQMGWSKSKWSIF